MIILLYTRFGEPATTLRQTHRWAHGWLTGADASVNLSVATKMLVQEGECQCYQIETRPQKTD